MLQLIFAAMILSAGDDPPPLVHDDPPPLARPVEVVVPPTAIPVQDCPT
jgi:hypothetical protein